MREATIGPVKVSLCDIPALLDAIREYRAGHRAAPWLIYCVNAHLFTMAAEDPAYRELLNRADVVAADGMSIVWAARLFGAQIASRCNMTEAFRAYMNTKDMPAAKAILLGCTAEVAARVAQIIHDTCNHCRIVHAYSGYLDHADYRRILSEHANADLVLLGMGSPKSERIGAVAADLCRGAVIWHVGGGTFNFLAGSIPEAPAWMRRGGLQWLHRLLLEPRRLWRRYLVGIPRFAWLVFQHFVCWRRSLSEHASRH